MNLDNLDMYLFLNRIDLFFDFLCKKLPTPLLNSNIFLPISEIQTIFYLQSFELVIFQAPSLFFSASFRWVGDHQANSHFYLQFT